MHPDIRDDGTRIGTHLPMPVLMKLIGLNTREAVVACADGVHGLMVSTAGYGVNAVALLAGLGITHFHRTGKAAMLYTMISRVT